MHRHLTDALRIAAATSPVVTLTGPRQSGKTTLVRALFTDYYCLSPDSLPIRGLAARSELRSIDAIDTPAAVSRYSPPARSGWLFSLSLEAIARIIDGKAPGQTFTGPFHDWAVSNRAATQH